MRLTEAIDLYVSRRRAEGSMFVYGETVLRSMCRQIGDVCMADLTASEVSCFFTIGRCSADTQRGRYSLVRRFLVYWAIRDEVPVLELPVPPRGRSTFAPYVYSVSQISAILSAVKVVQHPSCIASAKTVKMFLLMLYATGGVFNEVLHISRSQLNLEQCELELSGDQRTYKRRIPICEDLSKELQYFLDETHEKSDGDFELFTAVSGEPLGRNYMISRFLRVLHVAGVVRQDGVKRSPRMQDFRGTFAVHRIQAWVKEGADLDQLLPALSGYMGYASLCAAGKYLRLAPAHLLGDIEKLSAYDSA